MAELSNSTIYDVATHAGVSAMTVSRVLNDPERVAASTRERVEAAIQTLGYVPNTLARGLRSATRTLALVIPDVSNPFFTDMVRGAEEVAWRDDYTLFLGNTHGSPEQEARYLRKFIGHGVDGLLIAPSGHAARGALEHVQERGVPFVLVDAKVRGVKADTVLSNNVKGAEDLTRHLLNLGHRAIAFIGGEKDKSTAQERERGYRKTLQRDGLSVRSDYIHHTDFSRAEGFQVTRRLMALPEPPSAIFAANNTLVVGAAEALRELGLRVPEDVALVCFEDLELASALHPFLTVLAQPARTFGQVGAQLLLERIKHPARSPRSRVLPLSLIVRRSCGSQLEPRSHLNVMSTQPEPNLNPT